jgi:HAD superfamily hydrolase (TIGR01509 family)
MKENVIDKHTGTSSPYGSGYKKMLQEKKLRVFDFDDTLVSTRSKIYVTTKQGNSFSLTPAQFAVYEPRDGDSFDYSEFSKLISPKGIKQYNDVLKKMIKAAGDRKIVILTARASIKPVAQYLKSIGITSGVQMVGLAHGDPKKKAAYIERMINTGYDDIYFVDDSQKNIDAVNALKPKYPDVKINTVLSTLE